MNKDKTLNQALSESSPYLKGLAIIGIILHHYYRGLYGIVQNVQWIYSPTFLNDFFEKSFSAASGVFIAFFYYLGYWGVSAFFILSGWGLAMSSLKKSSTRFDYRNYYKNRLKKIMPLYLASLLFFWLLFHGQGGQSTLNEIISSVLKLFLLTNYSPAQIFTINPSFWFLGTIGVLYLLFPAIYQLIRKTPWASLVSALTISLLFTFAIQNSFLQSWHPFLAMGGFPLVKLGEFALGIFAAIIFDKKSINASVLQPFKYSILSIVVLLLGIFSFANESAYPLHPLLITLPLIYLSMKIYFSTDFWPKILAPITYAGIYSYSAFLLHRPFVDAWIGMNNQSGQPVFYGLLFLAVAVTLTSLFEIVCNKTTTPLLGNVIDRLFQTITSRDNKLH